MLSKEQELAEFARRKQLFQDFLNSPEYQARLVERLKLNDAGERSADARKYIWHLCARPDNPTEGAKFFINTFGWTFDPRPEHEPYHLPFITFEYQERAIAMVIDHIDNGRDLFIEKSRDMGISWLIFVWIILWYWLFRDGVSFLDGSYKEALVDDRTLDSLFGKLDYALRALPSWLLPPHFKFDKHRTKLRLVNPANSNLISGDTMNPDFARGSRKTAVLFDELGFWDYAQDAWGSAGDSTSCRIANSTPKGYNFNAMLRESGIDIATFHWKDHPLKDEKWYEFEKNRRSPEEVAQELDISYSKSQEGRCYPEWNDQFVKRGSFPYDPDLPLLVGWDFGKTDDTAIIWMQEERDGRFRIVDTYRKTGKNIDFFVPFVTGIIPSDTVEKYAYTPEEIEIIYEHRNWSKGTHFGDPAGRFRNQVSDETVISVLRRYGIIMNFKDAWKTFPNRKRATKDVLMDGINLNQNARTSYFDICISNAAFPIVKNEGVPEIRSLEPKHDYTSHYRSALEYLSLGIEDWLNSRVSRKPYDKFKKKDAQGGRKFNTVSY